MGTNRHRDISISRRSLYSSHPVVVKETMTLSPDTFVSSCTIVYLVCRERELELLKLERIRLSDFVLILKNSQNSSNIKHFAHDIFK